MPNVLFCIDRCFNKSHFLAFFGQISHFLTGFHPKPVFPRCFLFSKIPPNLDIDEIKPFSPFFWLYHLTQSLFSVKCQAQILALLSIFPPFFWLYLTQNLVSNIPQNVDLNEIKLLCLWNMPNVLFCIDQCFNKSHFLAFFGQISSHFLTGFHPKPVFLRCFLFSKMPPNLDIDEVKPFSPFFWLYYLIIMCSVKCQAQILALLSISPPPFFDFI